MEIHFLDPAPQNTRPVLMLHGLGADSRSWAFQFPALIEAGFRPIAPDLPGFGRSPAIERKWNIPSITDHVIEWMQEKDFLHLPVVGISMGGAIALQLALNHPEYLSQLVLVNTFACLRPRKIQTVTYLVRRFVQSTIHGGSSQAEIVAYHLFPNPDQAELRLAITQLIRETDPQVYRTAMRAIAVFDVRKWLSGLRTPTLVISGELDATVPLDNQMELVERIPGAQQVIIPNARHAVVADQPEKFNFALLTFLQSSDEASLIGIPQIG